MNRREFFAAMGVAPAPLPAAKPKLTSVSMPATERLSADMQRLADWIRGDHPLRLRSFSSERSEARFEFDVLASCTYTPPVGLDLGMPHRFLCVGDVLSVSGHVSTVQAKIDAVFDAVAATGIELAEVVLENTPAAPPPTP